MRVTQHEAGCILILNTSAHIDQFMISSLDLSQQSRQRGLVVAAEGPQKFSCRLRMWSRPIPRIGHVGELSHEGVMLNDPARWKLRARPAHRGDRFGDFDIVPRSVHSARGELVAEILQRSARPSGRSGTTTNARS